MRNYPMLYGDAWGFQTKHRLNGDKESRLGWMEDWIFYPSLESAEKNCKEKSEIKKVYIEIVEVKI